MKETVRNAKETKRPQGTKETLRKPSGIQKKTYGKPKETYIKKTYGKPEGTCATLKKS